MTEPTEPTEPNPTEPTRSDPVGRGREPDDALGIDRLTDDVMLHEPIMVVQLDGWIDAAGAAKAASTALMSACESTPIVRFDDDMYIDYRARRPTLELRDGVNTNLAWTTIELRAGRSAAGRDLLFLTGPEPDMAWRRFGRAVAQLADEAGVTQMVGLGAYPFAAPHTRTPRLSVSSPSTEVLARVSFARSSVDVPAGAAAMLEHTMHAAKVPSLGIWAQVPHYISTMEYPAASVALLDGLAEVTGVSIDTTELGAEVDAQRRRIDAMIADNDEHREMVRQLEELHDAALEQERIDADQSDLEMRSGDELAAEIQRFLRDQP